jgi:RNA polymerase sigma factor (sigma-70 family)
MTTIPLQRVVQTLRGATLHHAGEALTDGQLLERYVRSRDAEGFAGLVQRHGPMVWGVCRRLLPRHHDVEDAFQATFLVLVRKAASIVPREKVANWLYGVAYQTALKARATSARRAAREKQVISMAEPAGLPGQLRDDLLPWLDHELNRLPDKYRTVIVPCDLEGKTRKTAARHYNVPEGTIASRLASARKLLARRLARHVPAVTSSVLVAWFAQELTAGSMPALAASSTVKAASIYAAGQVAAAGMLSSRAVVLAEIILKHQFLARLKTVMAVMALVTFVGATGAALSWRAFLETRPDPRSQTTAHDDSSSAVPSGIWPQWRGPNRDGVVHGVKVPARWPKALKEEWSTLVGEGVASPVVVDGKVYVFTRIKSNELVRCLDLAGGKEIWHTEPYAAPYKPGPGEGDSPQTPRSTPAVTDGKIFVLGMCGILSCFDAKAGKLLWRKEHKADPYGGTSPLVVDGLCIVPVGDDNTGSLTAYDAKTGEMKWSCFERGRAMSGSVILVNLAGERQIVTFFNWNAAGVSLTTGAKLWGTGPGGGGQPCTTPVQYKDLIILADNMQPLRALRLERRDRGIVARDIWKVEGLPLYYSSPVVAGDLVFGFSTRKAGCVFCLDARTGRTLWVNEGRMGGHASILSAGSVLLILTDRGRLIVLKPNPEAYEPIASYQVSDNHTDAHPVFLGDRVLIKDDVMLRCLRIEQEEARVGK